MERIRTAHVPLWVTGLAIIIAVFGTVLGLASLLSPSEADVPQWFERAYGGRNLGIALVMGLAVGLRSKATYIAGFVAGVARDVGDLFRGVDADDTRLVVVGGVALSIGLIAPATLLRPERPGTA